MPHKHLSKTVPQALLIQLFLILSFSSFFLGLLDSLGHDDLDLTEIIGKVLEVAERHKDGM